MRLLMGIDIGTSSVKVLVMDHHGERVAFAQREYSFDIPRAGYAEQRPGVWWEHTVSAVREALGSGVFAPDIQAIGLSGQMHSLVVLDKRGEPLRPAILWCDQRTRAEVEEIVTKAGDVFAKITHNPVMTGSQIASTLWLKKHEPETYERTAAILTPKDYLRYRLTGEVGSEVTDASATLAFDVEKMQWSRELQTRLDLDGSKYPEVRGVFDIAGTVTGSAAAETGLSEGTKVIFGGADQVMQSLGNGIIDEGVISCTIGTGGQLSGFLRSPLYDRKLRVHTFCNAFEQSWYLMGATLSAGLSLKWLRDKVMEGMDYASMSDAAATAPAGSGGLLFLPYLGGERSPHMDPYAKAVWHGLTLGHDRSHMIRSVMEGVVFSLKDSLEVMRDLGVRPDRIIASGGGARSDVWMSIQADIFDRAVCRSDIREQACAGAAMAAGCAVGVYKDMREACAEVIRWSDAIVEPDRRRVLLYRELYEVYKEIYVNNRSTLRRCFI